MIGFVLPHRHNPQLLLTDQRSPEKKLADAMVASYREAFPDLLKTFIGNSPLGGVYDPAKHGTPTGRFHSGGLFKSGPEMQRLPVIRPLGEAVVPLSHVDFGQVEARVMRHYAIPRSVVDIRVNVSSFVESLEKVRVGTEQFARRMREHARAVSRLNDKMILLALFGDVNLDEPEPGFAYERRLAKLLKSRDPRQRKRGERLFKTWYRTRKGMNLYRGYSGK